MITYLRNSEIDKALWDQRISASPQGEAYALSWYLDIVSPGWDALVSENYSLLFPLTKRKKFGLEYLYQPYFTQQLGLFSANEVSEKDVELFLEAIPDRFRLVEIQLNAGNSISNSKKFEISLRKTHLLDLSQDLNSIRKAYSENLRRNLRKALPEVPVSNSCDVEEIVMLFRTGRGKKIDNLKKEDYERFLRLTKEGARRNQIATLCVRNGKMPVAGAVFLRSIHSWIFLFSATTEEGKKTGAMSRIIDTFIQQHNEEGKALDFEGSMDENLARYYKSFGSKEVVYLQVRRNNLPSIIRWLK